MSYLHSRDWLGEFGILLRSFHLKRRLTEVHVLLVCKLYCANIDFLPPSYFKVGKGLVKFP